MARKMYNTTIDIDLMRKIKILAARLEVRQNDILEEAIQNLLEKYNDQEPSLGFSDQIWGGALTILAYIAGGLLCIGWVIPIILSLSSKSEYDKLNKLFVRPSSKGQIHNPSETSTLE